MKAADLFADRAMITAAEAVQRDDATAVRELAASGLDVNATGRDGMTLLVWSMYGQRKAAMKALLELGADPNAKMADGDCAVSLAAGAKDIEMLQMLLEHKGDPNTRNRNGDPALFEAAMRSLWDHLGLLLKHGADITSVDRAGRNIIVRLAAVNRFQDVEKLLPMGNFDIARVDDSGATFAWYVDTSVASPKTSAGQARLRLKKWLEEKGVVFPVTRKPPATR